MKTIIELLAWGDFGVQYTECIMVSDKKLNVDDLKIEFYKEQNITSDTGLDYLKLHMYIIEFKNFLIKRGFKPLKTNLVSFSD